MRAGRTVRLAVASASAVAASLVVGVGGSSAATGPDAYFVGGPPTSQPFYELDMSTGEATLVDEVTVVGHPGHTTAIIAMAMAPDGTLYAFSHSRLTDELELVAEGELYTIDPATAEATLVAPTDPDFEISGMAFGPGGELFVGGFLPRFTPSIGTMDPATAETTAVPLSEDDLYVGSLAATCDGRVFGAVGPAGFDPQQPVPGYSLVDVDPGTGQVSTIGDLATGTTREDPPPQIVVDQIDGTLWGAAMDRGDSGFNSNTSNVLRIDAATAALEATPITEGGEPLRWEIQNLTFADPTTCAAAPPTPQVPAPTPPAPAAQPAAVEPTFTG